MHSTTVAVPSDLWDNIKLRVSDAVTGKSPFIPQDILQEMLECMNGVDVSKLDDESEKRRARIIEIAEGMPWVQQGEVEIGNDARVSEGSDNGCYVSGWVWCDFTDTALDKRGAAGEAPMEQLTEEAFNNEA